MPGHSDKHDGDLKEGIHSSGKDISPRTKNYAVHVRRGAYSCGAARPRVWTSTVSSTEICAQCTASMHCFIYATCYHVVLSAEP